MTLTFVTDFCAVKVRHTSTHECFANVLTCDSKAVEIYWQYFTYDRTPILMTLAIVTDFCAAKVWQISTYECFANVLNGDSKAMEIYWQYFTYDRSQS